jgi:dipeptidyl-peptidase 4
MLASPAGRALVVAALLARAGASAEPLTLERITSAPSIAGVSPSAPAWSPTSDRLAFLWSEGGAGDRGLYVVSREGGSPTLLAKGTKGAVAGFAWSPQGDSLVYLDKGEVLRVNAAGGAAIKLVEGARDRAELSVSPDGKTLAWVEEGDLWFAPAAGGQAERVTHVFVPGPSAAKGTYSRPDVELGQAVWGDTATYAWSPDSKIIAVHHVDRRGVRTVPFPSYLTDEPTLLPVRRAAPGDVNERRTIGLVDVATRTLRLLELPNPESRRVIDYSWSSKGQLLIDRETDDAVDHWLVVASPPAFEPKELWHDHGERRIYSETTSAWSADGARVLFTGDLDDRYRLYSLTPGQKQPKLLTSGPFDVQGAALTSKTGQIVFLSSEPLPSERHLYRLEPDGSRTRLTHLPGVHRGFVAPDGATIATLYSSDTSPPELYLLENKPDAKERRVTRSTPREFDEIHWVAPRYVTFPGNTPGVTLHGRIFFPPTLDPSKRAPVLFGPVYSNTVRNRWGGAWGLLQQVLVERGYIVVQVDSRGSTGYGRAFRERFLLQAGDGDLDDYVSAVAYVKTLPSVDPKRFGIFGSSYGGTLTLFALFKKPDLFAAGVAGAPAVDPKWFGSDDVAIARTPQTHPEFFAKGQAMLYAQGLRSPLLIIHGMADDVVPFQTTVQLTEHLIKLGKNFDVAFAPSATHGWSRTPAEGRYLLTKLIDHFDRHLGPDAR